jgi:hypothetical protein
MKVIAKESVKISTTPQIPTARCLIRIHAAAFENSHSFLRAA